MNDDTLAPGTVIDGKYRIIGHIGEGGMGIVYHAEHVLMRKHLALKRLHPHLSAIEQVDQRFEREAQAAARIEHANVCMVTDYGRDEAVGSFIVMELLKGTSLQDEIEQKGPLPFDRVLRIGRQICAALEQAHSMGIVHRDLKPDNIMLIEREGAVDHVKIMDFGIAKMVTDETPGQNLTQAGMIFGTPHYLSPEQASGDPVDHRGDLYSLGVILFEMSTARRPFDAPTAAALLRKHVTEEPPSLLDAAPQRVFPPGFQNVVSRLMAKSPEDRYPSAKVCMDHLESILELPLPEDTLDTVASLPPDPGSNEPIPDDAPDAASSPPHETESVSLPSITSFEASAEQNLGRLWRGGGWARWAILGGAAAGAVAIVIAILAVTLLGNGEGAEDEAEGSHEKALLMLEQERTELGENPAVKKALTLGVEGNPEESIAILEALAEEGELSDSAHVHYHLAVMNSNEGLVKEALEAANRCMELEPGYREEPILVGILVQALYERETSRKALKVMIAHDGEAIARRIASIAREEQNVRIRRQALEALREGNMLHHLEPWMRSAAELVDPDSSIPCARREELLDELLSTADARVLPTLALLKENKGFGDSQGGCWGVLEDEWQAAVDELGETASPD
jgi:serine/threonine-protein kinase